MRSLVFLLLVFLLLVPSSLRGVGTCCLSSRLLLLACELQYLRLREQRHDLPRGHALLLLQLRRAPRASPRASAGAGTSTDGRQLAKLAAAPLPRGRAESQPCPCLVEMLVSAA